MMLSRLQSAYFSRTLHFPRDDITGENSKAWKRNKWDLLWSRRSRIINFT